MMPPWGEEFKRVLKERVTEVAQALLDSVRRDPLIAGKYQLADLVQLINAHYVMMGEILDGSSESYDEYMCTAIPGIYAQGEAISTVVRQAAVVGGAMLYKVIVHISPANQPDVAEFIAGYWGKHCGDIVEVGLKGSAQ
jgi:hypothetical protein